VRSNLVESGLARFMVVNTKASNLGRACESVETSSFKLTAVLVMGQFQGSMAKIREIFKRLSLTDWLLFKVVALLVLIFAELRIVNQTLNSIFTGDEVNHLRMRF